MTEVSRREMLGAALAVAACGSFAVAGLDKAKNWIPVGMAQGPDGNMWFADWSSNAIIKINSATGNMTSYNSGLTDDAGIVKIVIGPGTSPDLWFTEGGAGKIGKITTSGVITEYPVAGASLLAGLAFGPDGNLWFCDRGRNSIGKAVVVNGAVVAVSLFSLPTAGALAESITAGPNGDGTLWFTEPYASSIGKISTSGVITEYTTPTSKAFPKEITLGSDGNLWFTEEHAHKIGKITTAGIVTEYTLATNAFPHAITAVGSDLWFTEKGVNKLAKITTAGSITEYAIPTRKCLPIEAAAGPSNTVWFAESAPRKAAKFDTATATFTEYTLPGGNTGTTDNRKSAMPNAIIVGHDGNLWFNAPAMNKVGKVSTDGVVTLYELSTSRAWPTGRAATAGGDLWFAEGLAGKIAKVTTSGMVTEYAIPSGNGYPHNPVEGPDGNVWFTVHAANKIAKITSAGTVTEYDLLNSSSSLPRMPACATVGPDGNLWYTALARHAIGKVVLLGGAIVDVIEYPAGLNSLPVDIISGGPNSDALWFTMFGRSKLGRITTSGAITEYNIPVYADRLTIGPDNNIWYTSMSRRKVVKFVPGSSPTTTEYTLPAGAVPLGLVTGPDGNLWITDSARGFIVKMTTSGTVAEYPLTHD